MERRGQGLSTSAIVLIVLGVIVLVILVLGFTIGWNRLLPFVQNNNVENIQTACSVACSTGNSYDFCTQNRTLKTDTLEFTDNCEGFATNTTYQQYNFGIDECAEITC